MSLYRDTGIVLRVHKLGEADRIITLLTRQRGIVRAVGKGVRKTTSRFGGRLEPFMHVDVQLAEYPEVWAAAGHAKTVFPTTFDELVRITGGTPSAVEP